MINVSGAIYEKVTFTESQIMAILKQHETGVSIPDLAREHKLAQPPSINGELSMVVWTLL